MVVVVVVVDTSRPVATVAREQGVNEQTLRNWVNEYRAAHAEEEPPLSVSERARLREPAPPSSSAASCVSWTWCPASPGPGDTA
jgi:transposase-like protein